jgi:polysaccharide pyruvyl transferase WcaK-like protein
MNILVRGAYGESNFGDDALMYVLESFFIQNGLSSNLVFSSAIDSDYCNKMLRVAKYENIIDVKIDGVDLIVYGGGTQFFAFGKKQSWLGGKIARLRELKLKDFFKLGNIIAVKKYNKQKAAIGIGLGPFNVPEEEMERYKVLARQFHFLAVRDDVSYKYVSDWGVENPVLGADICFSDYFNVNGKAGLKSGRKKKKIGIIVRDWIHDASGAAYNVPLAEAVKSSDDRFEFVYIVFAPDRDPVWMRELKGQKNVLVWNPEKDSIDGFVETMASFDGFVTARYHGAVFASLLNKPTVCVEIEPKLRILTEQVPEFALWKKPFDVATLKKQFDIFETESFDCSASVQVLKDKSNEMFRTFHQYVKQTL